MSNQDKPASVEKHQLPTGKGWSIYDNILSKSTIDVCNNVLGFPTMTAVQTATIPAFLSHKDVYVQAVTGSGKTLAFVIPLIEILNRLSTPLKIHDIGAIILTPTRELAQQIALVLEKFIKTSKRKLTMAICIGGHNSEKELDMLNKNGANIIIATPGRLDSILSRTTTLNVRSLELLIMDEADRLLECGYSININSILSKLPKQRRTGLFSATMSGQIDELARVGLRNPAKIVLKVQYKAKATENTPIDNKNDNNASLPSDSSSSMEAQSPSNGDEQFSTVATAIVPTMQHQAIPNTLTNQYMIIKPQYKILKLLELLLLYQKQKVIIFFLTCADVDFLYRVIASYPPIAQIFSIQNPESLHAVGLDTFLPASSLASSPEYTKQPLFAALHGQMSQSKRENILSEYRQHTSGILLCTDVAARGVDFPDIDLVIQYDPPQNPDFFVHRIGRAARAGRQGKAITFIMPNEDTFVNFMIQRYVPMNEIPFTWDYTYKPVIPGAPSLKDDSSSSTTTTTIPTPPNPPSTLPTTDDTSIIDSILWNPVDEVYYQQVKTDHNNKPIESSSSSPKQQQQEQKEQPDTDDSNTTTTMPPATKKAKHDQPDHDNTTNTTSSSTELLANIHNGTLEKTITLPPLPSCIEYKDIISFNTYKIQSNSKDNQKLQKNKNKYNGKISNTLKNSIDRKNTQSSYIQPELLKLYTLPPYTRCELSYYKPDSNQQQQQQAGGNSTLSKKEKKAQQQGMTLSTMSLIISPPLSSKQLCVWSIIQHIRYCIGYDRHLFNLGQKAYVSHINAYKEHQCKFVFPFDHLPFVHLAIGQGLLILPQLPDLKKFQLKFPHISRVDPKSILFRNSSVGDMKMESIAKRKEQNDKEKEARLKRQVENDKERQFKEKQREKKKKTRKTKTFEEYKRDYEELADEYREMKKTIKRGGKRALLD